MRGPIPLTGAVWLTSTLPYGVLGMNPVRTPGPRRVVPGCVHAGELLLDGLGFPDEEGVAQFAVRRREELGGRSSRKDASELIS